MDSIMLDLETLGRAPGCVILSIGAVAFDYETGELGPEYYGVINQKSCLEVGLMTDPETVAWWAKQSLQAKAVLYATCDDNGPQLLVALTAFSDWLKQFGNEVKVWGNGAEFDQPILAHAYHKFLLDAPWEFWNSRCYRTLKNLRPGIDFRRGGTYHNALDDAKTQAIHAMALLKDLNA